MSSLRLRKEHIRLLTRSNIPYTVSGNKLVMNFEDFSITIERRKKPSGDKEYRYYVYLIVDNKKCHMITFDKLKNAIEFVVQSLEKGIPIDVVVKIVKKIK